MSDARQIKELLRERVAELAPYLFPNGKREGVHWCVGSVNGEPGKSFKICLTGEKAGLWGDFAESGKHARSLLDLWMNARNADFKTALREAAEWAGCPLQGPNGYARHEHNGNGATGGNGATAYVPSLDWESCVAAFTAKHVERLSEWRGYSREFSEWLRSQKLVGLCQGCLAFPVHDHARNAVVAHCRSKDGSWFYSPKGTKTAPLIIGELVPGDPVHCFESQWDAFAFMEVSGERSGVIITRGASNGAIVADVIPKDSTVYAWPQNDAPG